MEQITTIIVDDEPLARSNLRKALEPYDNWRIITELDTGEQVLSNVQEYRADVVFLDIKMPKTDGVSTIKDLANLNHPPLVIFVTAYDSYAVEAFEFFALDYLLKPFSNKRLELSIRRAEQALRSSEQREIIRSSQRDFADDRYVDRLVIKSTGSIKILEVDDIYCVKASGNYVEVLHSTGVALHRTSLAFLEQKLNPNDFIRIHRSAIVRIREIKQIDVIGEEKYRIRLKNDEQLPLSETYRHAVLDKLGAL